MEVSAGSSGGRGAGSLRRALRSVGVFLEMVKVSHSIFALPFALAALFMVRKGWPPLLLLIQVVVAVVLARTAAMSFNRWADAGLDARNPRTAGRAIPASLLPRAAAGAAALLSAAGFVLAAAWIGRPALLLSPVALLVLLGYSYTKRFTQLSHLVLGLALGLSPVGAWVAAGGGRELLPAVSVLGAAVLFWTAGFDIIYACQDVDFDRRERLHSIPARFGVAGALRAARGFHLVCLGLLAAAGPLAGLGWPYFAGVLLVAGLLYYEHSLVKPGDLSRVDQAFFTVNGLVSLAFLGAVVIATVT
jgi:4-hydroxybenzoate polyprenyltransferase